MIHARAVGKFILSALQGVMDFHVRVAVYEISGGVEFNTRIYIIHAGRVTPEDMQRAARFLEYIFTFNEMQALDVAFRGSERNGSACASALCIYTKRVPRAPSKRPACVRF